ncbi:katanin p60 ATPase-containing subunit A-like 2 isoform X4 [Bolinopsis microptera]|uniref:katanin p60 ATPase-containing subunit A-like 2 isoform X4 n=1 Tax=Bolinopsis microptera TaxID=2820187 RepID=UPI003079780F
MKMELSYSQLKSSSEARESEEIRNETRKRSLILLIHSYLNEQGFLNAASALIDESNISLKKYALCDNMDLETVLHEFNAYYNVKFGRNPKIVKKMDTSHSKTNGHAQSNVSRKQSGNLPRNKTYDKKPPSPESRISEGNSPAPKKQEKRRIKSAEKKEDRGNHGNDNSVEQDAAKFDMGLTGTAVSQKKADKKGNYKTIIDVKQMLHDTIHDPNQGSLLNGCDDKLLKPLAQFANRDMRELAATISRDIYLNNPNVRWSDIFGLEAPKRIMKEAVVYPIKYPQLFTGILSPWKGLLLYGPPGTGKTLLAKAVATECNTTFFNISASSIVSKWRGDSEKLVRVLFELARYHAPSTIFVDELESLMSQRGSTGGNEHEGSLRMKTELLVQMDGLAKSDDLVFLLAASNLPWELDHAMLRRLEKRILVDLPTAEARKQMFKHHLPPKIAQEGGVMIECNLNYDRLADITEGYTGSDIQLVCKEAAMRRVRSIFSVLEEMETNPDNPNRPNKLKIDPVTTADVEAALQSTKPSARNLQPKYNAWRKQYESA